MKRFFMLVFTSLMLCTVSAQELQKNIVGVRAGLNVSDCAVSAGDFESKTAFHVGFSYERLLSKNTPLYLETGLQLSSKGFQLNVYGEEQYTCNAYYLELPLMLNYKINIKNTVTIYPSVGCYGAYGVAGKFKYEETGYELEVDTFSDEGGLQKMDLGYRVSASAAYKRLVLTIGYEGGFSNILDEASEYEVVGKATNQNFFVSLGFNF